MIVSQSQLFCKYSFTKHTEAVIDKIKSKLNNIEKFTFNFIKKYLKVLKFVEWLFVLMKD